MKCQGKSSQKLSGGGGRGEAGGLPLVALSVATGVLVYLLDGQPPLYSCSFNTVECKIRGKTLSMKNSKKVSDLLRYPCDSFCMAVIGQSLCVSNNCFSCATSFFNMDTSFWKETSERHVEKTVHTNLRPPCPSSSEIGELFCYV